MKTNTEQVDDCKLKLIIEFDQAESQKAYSRILKEVSKDAKIDGFPKGKIPAGIIEERVGKDYVKQQAVNLLLQEDLPKIIEEGKYDLLNNPNFETSNFDFDGELNIELILETRPEIKLSEYKELSIDAPQINLSEQQDVEKEISNMARQFAQPEMIKENDEKGLQEFDIVKMDCIGEFTDGTEMPNAELIDHVTEVVEERLAPGILPQMIGMKPNEEKEITVNFPEDYEEAEFSGKEAKYKVSIKTISRREALPIDDELAKKANFETLDALKKQIADDFEKTNEQFNNNRAKALIIDKLVQDSTVNLPSWLSERAAKNEAHARYHQENPQDQGHDHGEIEPTEADTTLGVTKLTTTLLFQEIAMAQEIVITQEELIQGLKQFEQMLKMFQPQAEINEQMVEMVKEQLSFDKIANWLLENNTINAIEEDTAAKESLKAIAEKYKYLPLPLYPQNQ